MGQIMLVRHAQASFGNDDCDRLSDLGHRQAQAPGVALAARGMVPDRVATGRQRRHRETPEGLAQALPALPQAEVLRGLDEFVFRGLLAARFGDRGAPEGLNRDRPACFRIPRDTVMLWQQDRVDARPEPWAAFRQRVRDALHALAGSGTTLAVSSGGPISLMPALVLEAPEAQMIRLQLQMKTCAVLRLIAGAAGTYLQGYNETAHVDAISAEALQSYS